MPAFGADVQPRLPASGADVQPRQPAPLLLQYNCLIRRPIMALRQAPDDLESIKDNVVAYQYCTRKAILSIFQGPCDMFDSIFVSKS